MYAVCLISTQPVGRLSMAVEMTKPSSRSHVQTYYICLKPGKISEYGKAASNIFEMKTSCSWQFTEFPHLTFLCGVCVILFSISLFVRSSFLASRLLWAAAEMENQLFETIPIIHKNDAMFVPLIWHRFSLWLFSSGINSVAATSRNDESVMMSVNLEWQMCRTHCLCVCVVRDLC